jgi:hypothetical protein
LISLSPSADILTPPKDDVIGHVIFGFAKSIRIRLMCFSNTLAYRASFDPVLCWAELTTLAPKKRLSSASGSRALESTERSVRTLAKLAESFASGSDSFFAVEDSPYL